MSRTLGTPGSGAPCGNIVNQLTREGTRPVPIAIVPATMIQTAQDSESSTTSARERRTRLANTTWGRILRYVGLIVGVVAGWNLGIRMRPEDAGADDLSYPLVIATSLGALLFLLTPYLTIGIFSRLRDELRRIEASDLIAGVAGLLTGGLASTLLAFPVSLLPNPFGQYLPLVVAVSVCSVAVLGAITKKRELMDLFGFRRSNSALAAPAKEVELPGPAVLLDTSAIIDGRVAGLVSGGFLPYRLIVPRFVLRELQLVADSDDYSRRLRGARGLKILEEMQSDDGVDLVIEQIDASGEDVDTQLVQVASEMDLPVLSGDTNLERVATLQNARVLNLHHLAELMRPALAVGDSVSLKIIQPGREYQQGVGYLDDGTMIVVDEGEALIGETVPVTVTRTLQTSSGRMMFARVESSEAGV